MTILCKAVNALSLDLTLLNERCSSKALKEGECTSAPAGPPAQITRFHDNFWLGIQYVKKNLYYLTSLVKLGSAVSCTQSQQNITQKHIVLSYVTRKFPHLDLKIQLVFPPFSTALVHLLPILNSLMNKNDIILVAKLSTIDLPIILNVKKSNK